MTIQTKQGCLLGLAIIVGALWWRSSLPSNEAPPAVPMNTWESAENARTSLGKACVATKDVIETTVGSSLEIRLKSIDTNYQSETGVSLDDTTLRFAELVDELTSSSVEDYVSSYPGDDTQHFFSECSEIFGLEQGPPSIARALQRYRDDEARRASLEKLARNQAGITDIFTDHEDGTATDTRTGHMWTTHNNGTSVMWTEAVEYCDNLELAGYSDWELPSIEAIKSLYYGPRAIECSTVSPDVRCHIHSPFTLSGSSVLSSSHSGMGYGYYKIFVFVREGFVRHRNTRSSHLTGRPLCVRHPKDVDVEVE